MTTNTLACLVRDALNLEYIKVVVTVVACIGLHLVEPFRAKTIGKTATHSSFKEFFTDFYISLRDLKVDASFFLLDSPFLSGVFQRLFDYGPLIVASVNRCADDFT